MDQDEQNAHTELMSVMESIDKRLKSLPPVVVNVPKQDAPDIVVKPEITVEASEPREAQIVIRHPRTILLHFKRGSDRLIESPIRLTYESEP